MFKGGMRYLPTIPQEEAMKVKKDFNARFLPRGIRAEKKVIPFFDRTVNEQDD